MSIIWTVCGYSLAFDSTGMVQGQVNLNSFIGGLGKSMMIGVTPDSVSGTIPEILFAAFQMTFAIITPALMIGAFAERMKFSAVLVFSSVWLLVVYVPICHMTWAGTGGLYADWGVMDFAGGIVVHVTAGFGALVACIMVGPRAGYPKHLDPPHNMTMTVTGTAMLWVGWLWIKLGKPSVLGAATGSIAGLAAITPASGYVGPIGAMAIGASSAVTCFIFATAIKRKFGYDDSLDVFGVHGVGGFLGTILCAVFASSMFGGGGDSTYRISDQLMTQSKAAVSAAIYTIFATFVVLKVIQLTIGIRVSGEAETRGLDLSEHEERGYILN